MNEQFKTQLFEAAQTRAKQSNFKFTDVATGDLKSFISNGVDRMTESDIKDSTKKDLAERNLIRLIEAMMSGAENRNLHESLDYKSYSEARMSICPLWPFC